MADYTKSSITVLNDIEHLRLRPSLYIGDVSDYTRLFDEVFDNALDEIYTGKCNEIKVVIDNDKQVFSVSDNGRGIPFDENSEIEKDTPYIICKEMRSSGKFYREDDSAYNEGSIGLHGIGLTAVLGLSNLMRIETYRDGKFGKYDFIKDSCERYVEKCKYPGFSTRITVNPSELYFEDNICKIEYVKRRLDISNTIYKNLKIYCKINNKNYEPVDNEKELIKKYLSNNIDNLYELNSKEKNEFYELKFNWVDEPDDSDFEIFSIVNSLNVNTGHHINFVKNCFENVIKDFTEKEKLNTTTRECLSYLKIYLNLKIKDPKFSSQTKEMLSKDTDISVLNDLKTKLTKYLKNNKDIINNIIERIKEERKHKLNKKISKKDAKRGSTKFTNLFNCKNNTDNELIIGEGLSAIGSLLKTRDPKKHAIMPLRGNPPNIIDEKNILEKILKNKKSEKKGKDYTIIEDIYYSINSMNYDKILLAADADPAGHFITALLISLFCKITPELVKEGRLYVCETPLYGHGSGKNFEPIWDKDELLNLSRNTKIRRFKGLGEFNPDELYVFILNDKKRKLTQVKYTDDMKQDIINMMGKSGSKNRKELIEKKVNIKSEESECD